MSDPQEQQRLREELQQLRRTLADVERRLGEPAGAGPSAPTVTPPVTPPPLPPRLPPVIVDQPRRETPAPVPGPGPGIPPGIGAIASPRAARESVEVRIGTYWVPRIGIAVLLMGMVLLITWSYQDLGRGGKVALSYLVCAVLGGLGIWLEKKTEGFARVLQAGALALTYFVTYAAHFVAPFQVIDSSAVALSLLGLVVAAIIIVAERKRSPALAGLALFFGYFTSVVSGVGTFTLAANALLAVAALVFLARNQWVTIAYGAVAGTYLASVVWIWRLNSFAEFVHTGAFVFPLGGGEFSLRVAFLTLYWLLFLLGGIWIRGNGTAPSPGPSQEGNRQPLPSSGGVGGGSGLAGFGPAERNGLLTLNNLFYFLLMTMLMHSAYPRGQWRFDFLCGGTLLLASALAWSRHKPARVTLDLLFMQGVLVATLGVLEYFEGVRLVAALALESVLLLVLARALSSSAVAWVARVAFAGAVWTAWQPQWHGDPPLLACGVFAAALGFIAARIEASGWPRGTPTPSRGTGGPESRLETAPTGPLSLTGQLSSAALFFAVLSTLLLIKAGRAQFGPAAVAWVWIGATVAVALVGALLRTQEIRRVALLPLALGVVDFVFAAMNQRPWNLAPAVALVVATFGFGLVRWGRARWLAPEADALRLANRRLRPFGIAGVVVLIMTTIEQSPKDWLLTWLAAEALGLVLAAVLARETLFVGLAVAALAAGTITFTGANPPTLALHSVAWTNLLVGLVLMIVAERLFQARQTALLFYDQTRRRLRGWMVAFVTIVAVFGLPDVVADTMVTIGWAVAGFLLLALGFAGHERNYRLAGLAVLACSLGRAVVHDLGGLEAPDRILSFIGLGVILLLLGFLYARNRERLMKWL